MEQMLCPFCGAYGPRQCEMLEEGGGECPWELSGEYEPDDERQHEEEAAAEERRRLENEEMDEHFRRHPHG